MMRPKISVVIPVYNVEKYLRKCLDSIVNQTLNDIEIICVDDGSTDNCPLILDEYALQDSRMRVIHKENGGYGKAVNIGMDHATGEYFAILESDDMVDLQMYEELYRIAKQFNVDIVKGDYSRFIEDKGVIEEQKQKITCSDMYNRVIYIREEMQNVFQKAALYTWSGIYNLDFLRTNGIRHNETPGASYQDNGFWFLTVSSARTIYFCDKVFYKLRRDNPNSSFFSNGKVYCICDEYDYILNFLNQKLEVYADTIPYYWAARLGAYLFNYNRIAPEFRAEFLSHFYQILLEAEPYMIKELYPDETWKLLLEIKKNPTPENKVLQRAVRMAESKLRRSVTASYWKRLLWCCEDHGIIYTIKYLVKKVL